MSEEFLITLVRDHRELYDTNHKLYEHHPRREEVWREIGKKIGQPAQETRDRWKRLRDNYRKAKKLRQIKKLQGAAKIKPIKHEKILSFIDPFLEISNNDPNDTMTFESDSGSCSGLVQEKQEDISDASMDPLIVLNRPYLDEPDKKCDTVVAFFTNLGETVKTFPEAVQIRVKRDIFKIINDAEEEVLNMRNFNY